MKILVATASRHGSTDEVGDVIADVLREAGHVVDRRVIDDRARVGEYDAAVIGGAVYMGKWLPRALEYLEHNQAVLTTMPVWLFSSGPIGPDVVVPPMDPRRLNELMTLVHARGHQMFSGKLDREHLNLGEKLTVILVKAPEGDFRQWEAIRTWAREIDSALRHMAVTTS